MAEHLLEALDAATLVALLNVHWQKQMAIRRRSRAAREISPLLARAKQEESDLAFGYFALIDTLTDDTLATPASATLRKLFTRWMAEEGKEVIGSIRSIEILLPSDSGEGVLGRVHFQMPEFVQLVWTADDVEEKKQEILQEVKRDNPEEKLKDFWLRTDELIAVLRHQFRLRKLPSRLERSAGWPGFVLGSFIGTLARGHLVLFWTSTTAAFVLNFVMLLTIGEDDVDDNHTIGGKPELGIPAVILFVSICFEILSHIVAHVVLLVSEKLSVFRTRGGIPYSLPLISHTKTKSTTIDTPVSVKLRALLRGEEVMVRPLEFNYAAWIVLSDMITIKYEAVYLIAHRTCPAWSMLYLLYARTHRT